MEPGEFNFWASGLWLIPLLLIGTIAAVVWLVRRWQKQVVAGLKLLGSELRRFNNGLKSLSFALQSHSVDDPEPYGSRVRRLLEQIDDLNMMVRGIEQQRVALQEQERLLRKNLWRSTMGASFQWYTLEKNVESLQRELAKAQETLAAANEQEQKLSRLSWEVAGQARQTSGLQEQVRRLVEELRSKNLHGDALDSAARGESLARQALGSLPKVLLEGDEAQVIENANKISVGQAHSMLEATGPALETLRRDLEDWKKQYATAQEKVAAMRQALNAAQGAVDAAPQALALDEVRGRLGPLAQIAGSLQATLARMEVESMPEVIGEAEKSQRAASEIETQLKRARQGLATLETAIPELNNGLKRLTAQFGALASSSQKPVAWGETKAALTALNKGISELGEATRPRRPAEVEADLRKAGELNGRLKEMLAHTAVIAQQHGELLALLNSDELKPGSPWQAEAAKTTARIAAYDPENWQRADSVAGLAAELQAMQAELRQMQSAAPNEAVRENELAERVESAHRLAETVQVLRSRLVSAATRLEAVQAMEQQARDLLDHARNALNSLIMLIHSNPVLDQSASTEAERLMDALNNLANEMELRERGLVEKKLKNISAQVAKIEQSANTWLDTLNADALTQVQEISAALARLDSIAQVDDPAVAEARRLLSTAPSMGLSGRLQKSRIPQDELVLEFRRRNEFWQACSANLNALEDIRQDVVQAFESANQARDEARDQFGEIEEWKRRMGGWPPTTVNFAGERQELRQVEEQWEALKVTRIKAITLVHQLGNLSTGYHTQAEKSRQAAERAYHEIEKIESLEHELYEYLQLWQSQWTAHRENPTTSEEIRILVADIERELENIKAQSRQGARHYDQVLQAMQLLHRRARISQVALDDRHAIDVNGRVIGYR